jgi:hypothetical protein
MPSVSMDSPRFEVLQDGFIYGCFHRLHFALVFADVLCGRQWNPSVDQITIYDRESGWIKEREPMINHHNAPSYAYLGFTYKPVIEHEDDDGIRKATHYVHRNGHDRHDFIVHASPYRWLTLDSFQHAVDMHCDGVPLVTEDEVQDQYLADGLKASTLVTVITELANGDLSPSEFRKFILSEVEDGND